MPLMVMKTLNVMRYIVTMWVMMLALVAGAEEAGEGEEAEAREVVMLGTGCFWCTEAVFERIPGVVDVVSGYTGGRVENPSYEQVCSGRTGHAEVVRVEFDPRAVTLAKLLETFWGTHDPTTLNRQGADVGTQYRSAIFYTTDKQREVAEMSKREHAEDFDDPIVTEITAATTFYAAERYHQNYHYENPRARYSRYIDSKLEKYGLGESERVVSAP